MTNSNPRTTMRRGVWSSMFGKQPARRSSTRGPVQRCSCVFGTQCLRGRSDLSAVNVIAAGLLWLARAVCPISPAGQPISCAVWVTNADSAGLDRVSCTCQRIHGTQTRWTEGGGWETSCLCTVADAESAGEDRISRRDYHRARAGSVKRASAVL